MPEYTAKFVKTLWFTRPLTEFRFLPFIIGLEINQSDVHKNHTTARFLAIFTATFYGGGGGRDSPIQAFIKLNY